MKKYIPQIVLVGFIILNILFGWYITIFPQVLVWLTSILLVSLWVTIWIISSLSPKHLNFYWQLVAPTLFLIAATIFYIFFNTPLLQKIFWLLVSLGLAVYLYNMWLFYKKPARYQAFTLENFSWYLHLASSFLFTSALFGLIVFINLPTLYAILLIMIFCALIFMQMWWIQKLDTPLRWWWLGVYVIVGTEFFVVLKMLPFSFYLLGFWWTGIWYLLTSFIFTFSKDTFVIKKFLLHALVILSICVALTLTTKFF